MLGLSPSSIADVGPDDILKDSSILTLPTLTKLLDLFSKGLSSQPPQLCLGPEPGHCMTQGASPSLFHHT